MFNLMLISHFKVRKHMLRKFSTASVILLQAVSRENHPIQARVQPADVKPIKQRFNFNE